MPKLSELYKKRRVNLENGLWIDISEEFTASQTIKMEKLSIENNIDLTFGKDNSDKDNKYFVKELCVIITAYIFDWNLEDNNGKKIPITFENVSMLKIDSLLKINDVIGDINNVKKNQEKQT